MCCYWALGSLINPVNFMSIFVTAQDMFYGQNKLYILQVLRPSYLQYLALVLRQVTQLLQLDLVRLALVQICECLFVLLRGYRCGGCEDVLEPDRIYWTSIIIIFWHFGCGISSGFISHEKDSPVNTAQQKHIVAPSTENTSNYGVT